MKTIITILICLLSFGCKKDVFIIKDAAIEDESWWKPGIGYHHTREPIVIYFQSIGYIVIDSSSPKYGWAERLKEYHDYIDTATNPHYINDAKGYQNPNDYDR